MHMAPLVPLPLGTCTSRHLNDGRLGFDMHRRTVLVAVATFIPLAGCTTDDDEEFQERGTLEIVIDGTPVDLTADRFQAEHAEEYAMEFHLHDHDEYWYMEGDGRVTVAEAIDYLPHFEHEVEDGFHVIGLDDDVYREADSGTEIQFHVNDDEIDPTTYELHEGDHLHVEISTEG